jgi:hypothetical protein
VSAWRRSLVAARGAGFGARRLAGHVARGETGAGAVIGAKTLKRGAGMDAPRSGGRGPDVAPVQAPQGLAPIRNYYFSALSQMLSQTAPEFAGRSGIPPLVSTGAAAPKRPPASSTAPGNRPLPYRRTRATAGFHDLGGASLLMRNNAGRLIEDYRGVKGRRAWRRAPAV